MTDARLDIAARVLGLLDRGAFVATYKYAVLLGLLDLCLERSLDSGAPPDFVTTRQLAGKVVELYWRQVGSFSEDVRILRQNNGKQARILEEILAFQRECREPGITLWRARHQHAVRFERLLDEVEWTLVKMPLPKLQRVGTRNDAFLYAIAWDDAVAEGRVRRYQRGAGDQFDNRIVFQPGVAGALVALNGLLRPFIHREWCALVASLNGLPDSLLDDFLFGTPRTSFPEALRRDLVELQRGACFYCDDELRSATEIDHFIPWARFPTDAVENLVAAHRGCNGHKRDHLAAVPHLEHWWERFRPKSERAASLGRLAAAHSWPTRAEEVRGVGRSLYRRTPDGAPLWMKGKDFQLADERMIGRVLQT
ncbi:MAG: HNH endonuclease [Planctomycetes bacterium]|nr:HNH endonuclease [Planctomycetota bacterium]